MENMSSSLWGCELKRLSFRDCSLRNGSSSLWGCELKNRCRSVRYFVCPVILLVRMWVENFWAVSFSPPTPVILLVRMWVEKQSGHLEALHSRHPPCEDVSWKVVLVYLCYAIFSHPPCEDVSWKIRSIKYWQRCSVILHVRMWVEK